MTTETIALYTTVCPVAQSSAPSATIPAPAAPSASTTTIVGTSTVVVPISYASGASNSAITSQKSTAVVVVTQSVAVVPIPASTPSVVYSAPSKLQTLPVIVGTAGSTGSGLPVKPTSTGLVYQGAASSSQVSTLMVGVAALAALMVL